MRGTYFLGNGAFETRDMPEHPLAPREVLIQVAACGVCGTDVHIYHGDKGSAEVIPPVVLGHELSGTVAAVGAAVKTLQVGDHVAVDPNSYCGECHYCRRGKKQLCTNLHAIGVNENGGFADFCYAPEAQCFLLDPELPLEYGAMAELAKLSGASQVLLSEPVQTRREIGLQLGANAAIDPIHEDLTARIRALTGMDGVDVVIECVGNTIATAQAFSATKRGTTVLLFSVPKSGTTHPLSLEDVYQKELTIVGSIINPDTHQRAVDLINSGRIQLAPILTHRFPIERLKDAILMQMSSESLKVLVGSSYQ